MSTQHPDNATVPFFASSAVLAGEDEIREAFYAFSHLGCDEQMWDVEGKEIDLYVVRKLLSRYEAFFREHVLGEDVRLTLRVPNPTFERTEGKVLLETLESIPRSSDAARAFYGRDVAPIFQVILPMTTSSRAVNRVYRYYADHIVARQHRRFTEDDITIAEWFGDFHPPRIDVIPLFEDASSMLRAHRILERYLADKELSDQRVFLARSDTAMNYGLVSAALANKIALARLGELAARTGIRLHPILGLGSAPFRGGLSPSTAQRVGREYPSAVTFTVQSSFKFDHPPSEVRAACEHLRTRPIGSPGEIEIRGALAVMKRTTAAYRQRVVELAPRIDAAARFVPARRARKLHIGLFGYARSLGGVRLPRAISFTCALYSLGLPPELIAFDALSAEDLAFVRNVYPSVDAEISAALRFADLDGPLVAASLRTALLRAGFDHDPDREHLAIVRRIRDGLDRGEGIHLSELVTQAALLRRFLG
jgi:phosphoenolpyruvate carboxylase